MESEERQQNAKSKKQMFQQDRSGENENTVQALESELQRQERQLRKELHEV